MAKWRLRLCGAVATMTIATYALCSGMWRAEAASYTQTNLVSDIPMLAEITDPELVNSWGLTNTMASPFWISDQGTNATTLYDVTDSTTVSKVNINPPAGFVLIPNTASGPQGPTGAVANTNASSFPVVVNGVTGASAHFIFANLNGTISAWNTGTTAFTQVTTSGAIYTGLAINEAQTQIYAANNAAGSIDVFSSSFAPATNLGANAFMTPHSISALGLVPFNVQDIGGNVYVTYAPSGRPNQQNAAQGQGAVAVFTENGMLLNSKPILTGGTLAAPWGVALAPSTFGEFANDLLVGNFSYENSFISAFDPTSGLFKGEIPIDIGAINAGGLWALAFGIGGNNGSPNTLYFTDGINSEMDGLFGAINAAAPLPSALPLFATGLGALGLLGWRRKRKQQN